ncbi:unnamed protein product [Microthlaspi erraticum]|uniref:Uncharacterized protein n=1 Tax=Microthlaspi erraticum TaxID=1685480 RepID=A0A6D2LBQ0_9BRAS|nr:unnamed protein product [Microthlaspi erraticum]
MIGCRQGRVDRGREIFRLFVGFGRTDDTGRGFGRTWDEAFLIGRMGRACGTVVPHGREALPSFSRGAVVRGLWRDGRSVRTLADRGTDVPRSAVPHGLDANSRFEPSGPVFTKSMITPFLLIQMM